MKTTNLTTNNQTAQDSTASMTARRIIGSYEGQTHGDLFLVITTLHGNEPAGSSAVQTALNLLNKEKSEKPDFDFKGKIVGLIGNLAAQKANKRYIDTDMNRLWQPERIEAILAQTDEKKLLSEEREVRELLAAIYQEVDSYKPVKVYILDLHTTTAEGGIFTITPDNSDEALRIALTLFAPVITGFSDLLKGTLTSFFNKECAGLPCTTLTFESGQHLSQEAVTNAVSVIINILRAVNFVNAADVEDKHDALLRARAATLPRQARLLYRHPIQALDRFVMKPGYQNFQRIAAKEIIAEDRKGVIRAQKDCLILMPLYQTQGNDGFFLIEVVEE